jgi:hypothetical protein
VSVAGDQVAGGGRRAADPVAVAPLLEIEPVEVARGVRPARVSSQEIGLDDVARVAGLASELDGVIAETVAEAVDDQAADGRVAALDQEPAGEPRLATVQLDAEHGVCADGGGVRLGASLRVAIDDDGIGDRGQARLRLDGFHTAARDVEGNGVFARVRVGRHDRLPQRAIAGAELVARVVLVLRGVDDKRLGRAGRLRRQRGEGQAEANEHGQQR